MSGSRRVALAVIVPLGLFGLIQLVPYGHDHSNPPAGPSPNWDSPRTLELARRACFDCHSNETRWPWYASIAPISWRLQTHVNEGREKLNFSAFNPQSEDVAESAGEAGETVGKGEMPPNDYLWMHAEARLTAEEKRALIAGLNATFAAYAEKGEGDEGGARADSGRAEPSSGEAGEQGGEKESKESERGERERH